MKQTKSKTTNQAWFKPVRRSYLPASWEGFAVYLMYVIYEALLLLYWYSQGHNYGRLLTNVIPLAVAAAVLAQFIAARNSR